MEVWSWNEPDDAWEDEIPELQPTVQPWRRGLLGKGLIDQNGNLRIWSINQLGEPHHDDVAARERTDYAAKVDIRPDGRVGLTQPDETSLYGIDRDRAEEFLNQLAPQFGLRFQPGFFAKRRQGSIVTDGDAQWTDIDPSRRLLHRGPPPSRLATSEDFQPTDGERLRMVALEDMAHPTIIADRTCSTCGDPLKGEYGTFCPRCQWSEDNANLDSDPLSNPPDPTRDLHRGIQARMIPSHRWAKWYEVVEDF